jgi:AraC-like DNA-binding protein/mannose-6-phosphate isomerase-like protein (cupin superfamily)
MENYEGIFKDRSFSSNLQFSPEGKHIVSFSGDCPLEIGFHSFLYNHRLTPSYHDHFEITYIFKGEGTFHIENKRYEANEGDIFIIGNTEFHRLEAHHVRELKTIALYFLPEFVYSVGQNSFDFEYLRPFFDHSFEFTNKISKSEFNSYGVLDLMKKIYEEKLEKRDFFQLAVKNYLTEILLLIIRHYRKFSSDLIEYNKRSRNLERLKKVFSFLQNHYQESISLESVAQIACMSPSYFCKFFKKVTGSTLTDYIFRLRIDRAKELLLSGDLNITKIAYETGFESHSYFDRIFRRFTRLSPHEYRYQLAVQKSLPPSSVNLRQNSAQK